MKNTYCVVTERAWCSSKWERNGKIWMSDGPCRIYEREDGRVELCMAIRLKMPYRNINLQPILFNSFSECVEMADRLNTIARIYTSLRHDMGKAMIQEVRERNEEK